MRKRRNKGIVFAAVLLVITLSAASVLAGETGVKGRPGEEVTVSIRVKANPNKAVAALLKLEYDHSALELVPSDFIRKDTALLLDLNGIGTGENGEVTFRLNAGAKRGEYPVNVIVTAGQDYDERYVSGPEMENAAVIIGKAKEKPEDVYYPNGKLKKKVELNAAGNVQRVTFYDRYGNITRTEDSDAWDQDGNITRETDHYPWEKETDVPNVYNYTYDQWGNTLTSECTEGGSKLLWRNTFEYDSLDHRTKTVKYDENGVITGYNTDFVYDADDHVVSYTSLKADGQTESLHNNTWQNGVCVESVDRDPKWGVTGRYTYDPVYGDTLVSDYFSDGTRYVSLYNYYEDYYESDYRDYGSGWRYVTVYGADGSERSWTSYNGAPGTDNWVQSSHGDRVVNEAGNTVTTTYNEDGSRSISESDSNGQTLKSTYYNSSGEFSFSSSYEYDSKGQQIRRNSLTESGEIESYSLLEYDENGNQSKTTSYNGDGTFNYSFSYGYDSDGRQIRSNYLNEDGSIKSYELYEYDAGGNKTRETDYKGDGTYDGYTTYEYDENGAMTHYCSYNKNDVMTYEAFYRTLEDGTRQSKRISYNSDGSLYKEYDWE